MGNLTNPISLRIKVNMSWNSTWVSYINNNYSYILSSDFLLYSYLNWFTTNKIFSNFGWLYFYSHYKIIRMPHKVCVVFFFKDYKFYRFVFEYLSLILKLIQNKNFNHKGFSAFNKYKYSRFINKSLFNTHISTQSVKTLSLCKNNFRPFIYYSCWLFTFYLMQQLYVQKKNQNSSETSKYINFFSNLFKLSNFLNLFYFNILLYFTKIYKEQNWYTTWLFLCYNFYSCSHTGYSGFFFNNILKKKSCVYFFTVNNTLTTHLIVLKKIKNKLNKRSKLFAEGSIILRRQRIYFSAFSKFLKNLKRNYSNVYFKNTFFVNKKKNTFFFSNKLSIKNKSILIVKIFKILAHDFINSTKYSQVSKRNKYIYTIKYISDLSFFKTYLKYLYGICKYLKTSAVTLQNMLIISNVNIHFPDLLKKYSILKKQKIWLRDVTYSKIYIYLTQCCNCFNKSVTYTYRSVLHSFSKYWIVYCFKFFLSIIVKVKNLDKVFIHSWKAKINRYFKFKNLLENDTNYLKRFSCNLVYKQSNLVFYLYSSLYCFFYFFNIILKKNKKRFYKMSFIYKIFYLNSLKLKLKAGKSTQIVKDKKNVNAFILKYSSIFNKNKSGKLVKNFFFNYKLLLAYRKNLFYKEKQQKKNTYLINKYFFFNKYRYLASILYPALTFNDILLKYTIKRNFIFCGKYTKIHFKADLINFFGKYVHANTFKFKRRIVFNANLIKFYEKFWINILTLFYLRKATHYLYYIKIHYMSNQLRILDKKVHNVFNTKVFLCLAFNKFLNIIYNIFVFKCNAFLLPYLTKLKYYIRNICVSSFNYKKFIIFFKKIYNLFCNTRLFYIMHNFEITKFRIFFYKYIVLLKNTVLFSKIQRKKHTVNLRIFKYNIKFLRQKKVLYSKKKVKNFVKISNVRVFLTKALFKCSYLSIIFAKKTNILKYLLNKKIIEFGFVLKKKYKNIYCSKTLKYISTKNFLFKFYLYFNLSLGKSFRNILINKFKHIIKKIIIFCNIYYLQELQLNLYIAYWQQKKTPYDFLVLRQSNLYNIICFLQKIARIVNSISKYIYLNIIYNLESKQRQERSAFTKLFFILLRFFLICKFYKIYILKLTAFCNILFKGIFFTKIKKKNFCQFNLFIFFFKKIYYMVFYCYQNLFFYFKKMTFQPLLRFTFINEFFKLTATIKSLALTFKMYHFNRIPLIRNKKLFNVLPFTLSLFKTKVSGWSYRKKRSKNNSKISKNIKKINSKKYSNTINLKKKPKF